MGTAKGRLKRTYGVRNLGVVGSANADFQLTNYTRDRPNIIDGLGGGQDLFAVCVRLIRRPVVDGGVALRVQFNHPRPI